MDPVGQVYMSPPPIRRAGSSFPPAFSFLPTCVSHVLTDRGVDGAVLLTDHVHIRCRLRVRYIRCEMLFSICLNLRSPFPPLDVPHSFLITLPAEWRIYRSRGTLQFG